MMVKVWLISLVVILMRYLLFCKLMNTDSRFTNSPDAQKIYQLRQGVLFPFAID